MRDTDVPAGRRRWCRGSPRPSAARRTSRACPAPAGSPAPPMLRGVVHDPTARRMGGVAGHAGLFTTADDLARFCRMLLGDGTLDGVRILSPLSVARMMAPSTPAGEPNVRGLGWDLDSSFSSNRGELFPLGSFGHTGFTGTSMWIDPATPTYVVVAQQPRPPRRQGRRHAAAGAAGDDRRGRRRRGRAGRRLPPPGRRSRPRAPSPRRRATGEPAPRAPVLTGIDVLRAEGFARLAGAKVALLTNHTGVARDGTSTIDLLHAREEPDAGGAVQPGARHPRHAGRQGAVRHGREDRPADPLALRRHAAADRRDAGGRRHDRRRPAGRRRALLHLRRDDGAGDGGGGAARASRSSSSIGPTRSTAGGSRDRPPTRRCSARPATCACRSATG